jgi:hypothetical protein
MKVNEAIELSAMLSPELGACDHMYEDMCQACDRMYEDMCQGCDVMGVRACVRDGM